MQNKFPAGDDGSSKLRELFRIISIALLCIHFYGYCYFAFDHWHMTARVIDRFAMNFFRSAFLRNTYKLKMLGAAAMIFSFIGIKAKENETLNHKAGLVYLLIGIPIYFFSPELLKLDFDLLSLCYAYMAFTITGYMLLNTGISIFAKALAGSLSKKEIFNT